MTSDRKKLLIIAGIVALPMAFVVGYAILMRTPGGKSQSMPVVDWQLLKELNLDTGVASERLKAHDGGKVRIPGFMVPLEDNKQTVTEFLLVPNPQACIHIPPPPPNQQVLIRMQNQNGTKTAFGPIWVEGTLRFSEGSHMYGKSSFTMIGETVEPYKVDY